MIRINLKRWDKVELALYYDVLQIPLLRSFTLPFFHSEIYTCVIFSTALNSTVLVWIFPLSFFQLSRATVEFLFPDLLNKQNNCTTVSSFPRLGVYARVTFAHVAGVIVLILYRQNLFKGGLPKQRTQNLHPSTAAACEAQSSALRVLSSPQALWLIPACITWKSFPHHFLHITLRHSIPRDPSPANAGRTHLFDLNKTQSWEDVALQTADY